MIVDIFLIIIIVVSLFILSKILIGKFSILRKIKIERISKEKQKETKSKILEKRFVETMHDFPMFKKIVNFFINSAEKIKERLEALEQKYKDKFSQIIKQSPVETEKEIEKLIVEADNFFNGNDLEAAEQKFKKVLTFNSRHLGALKSLLKIYFLENSLKEAKNISEYIFKINKQAIKWWRRFNKTNEKIPENLIQEITQSLINLGEIFDKIGQKAKAIVYFKAALSYNPNNPRILDFLIENSIILRKKEEAEGYLIKIKEINPENQKISAWNDKIKNLS